MKCLNLLTVITLLVTLFFGCKKDANELSSDIRNIVPDSIIKKMEEMGMPINGGKTPPDIQNIYLASPQILKSSNISNDYVGKEFADYYFKFYNQNNSKLSISMDSYNAGERGIGLGGFVAGKDDNFSVFLKLESTHDDDKADLIVVISGTAVTGAIKDFHYANFMLENYGNPNDYWINIGEGRVIYDSDGNSPVVSAMPGKGSTGKTSSASAKR